MADYKKATRLDLRFDTPKGSLQVQQLWTLSLRDIENTLRSVGSVLMKNQKQQTEENELLSFLNEKSVSDPENELKFEILKDIYVTVKKEKDELKSKADKKAHNEKILALIAEKQETDLKSKSIEDLKALLM